MGRHKLTNTQARLTGADKKNPNRYKTVDPIVDFNIGQPPKYMSPDEKAAWKEIIDSIPEGAAAKSDRIMIEVASCLLAQMRSKGSEFASSRQNTLISCLSKFGLTPVDRQKLGINRKTDDYDDWSDI